MFGPMGMGRAMAQREQAKTAPRRDVTALEFVVAAVASGMTDDEAARQAQMSRVLGAATLIGGEMLTIKE